MLDPLQKLIEYSSIWSSLCFLLIIPVNIFFSCYANLPLDEMCYEVGRRGERGNWGIGKQRRLIILRSFSSVIWFKNMFWNYYPCQCCIVVSLRTLFAPSMQTCFPLNEMCYEVRRRDGGNWGIGKQCCQRILQYYIVRQYFAFSAEIFGTYLEQAYLAHWISLNYLFFHYCVFNERW